jgi:hypothetical protein
VTRRNLRERENAGKSCVGEQTEPEGESERE